MEPCTAWQPNELRDTIAQPVARSGFCFYLRGEINRSTAADLQVDLDEAIGCHEGDFVIDCGDVTFIDAAGAAVFVATRETLDALGRALRIENAGHLRSGL